MHPTVCALCDRLRPAEDLELVANVLDWDQATYMPPAGADARGRQMALLSTLAHEHRVHDGVGRLIEQAESVAELSAQDRAMVRRARQAFDRATKLPAPFVTRMRTHLAQTYVAWTQARPADDFARMVPMLERSLELSLEYAGYFGAAAHPMDALIDRHDPGATVASVDVLFAQLRGELVPFVRDVLVAAQRAQPSRMRLDLPGDAQQALSWRVALALGYDAERGRLDTTHHPFMTKFGLGDVRITTRIKETDFLECLYSVIHEVGHALYEQGIDRGLEATVLGHGASTGLHESQSRLWENFVGRSGPFAQWMTRQLTDVPAGPWSALAATDYHRAVNRVGASLIRTESDEVTYNLHIMIRFELERALLEGKLKVKELAQAWRDRYDAYLGVRPGADRDGVLQDVHWYTELPGGMFQGYTLGNLMAAQLYDAAQRALPTLEGDLAQGHFAGLLGWLRTHVHRFGAEKDALDVVRDATGRDLSIDPFMNYLKKKYGALYGA